MKFVIAISFLIITHVFVYFLLAYCFMLVWSYAVTSAITIARPVDLKQSFCIVTLILAFSRGPENFQKK